jgi:hypothetical protein
MELLSFKEFIAEEVIDIKPKIGGFTSAKLFPVTIGDRNITNAIGKLPTNDNFNSGRKLFRVAWNPLNKKFYTWHSRETVHRAVRQHFNLKEIGEDVANYIVDLKNKTFASNVLGVIRPEKEKTYFKGFKEKEDIFE